MLSLPTPTLISSRIDHEQSFVLLSARTGLWRLSPGKAGEPHVIEQALAREVERVRLGWE